MRQTQMTFSHPWQAKGKPKGKTARLQMGSNPTCLSQEGEEEEGHVLSPEWALDCRVEAGHVLFPVRHTRSDLRSLQKLTLRGCYMGGFNW